MRNRIIEALREMEANPFAGDIKPMKGLRGMFRRRVGDYRISLSFSRRGSKTFLL
jgi:mRNA-degrading endonuclease RelE of RelBE toxin-antitoxin system